VRVREKFRLIISLKEPRKHPTAEKVEAIKDALRYFEIMEEI
jgi:hypothetical protein